MRAALCIAWLATLAVVPGCHRESASDQGVKPSRAAQPAQLDALYARYWQDYLRLNPDAALSEGDTRYLDHFDDSLSDEYRAATSQLVRDSLERLKEIDGNALPEQERISYEMFRYLREQDARFYSSPLFEMMREMPISQMGGQHAGFAEQASGEAQFPFRTADDYRRNLVRADGFDKWVTHAISRMREGVTKGVVLPRVLVERMLPQFAIALDGSVDKSIFYRPIREMPEAFPEGERKVLAADYRAKIEGTIRPAYQRLHDFLKDEYLAAARDTAGIQALPGGKELYAFLIQRYTNTDLSAQQLHDLGLKEVQRIMQGMAQIQEQVGFKGTLQQFFAANRANPALYYRTRAEVLADFESARNTINARLALLFDVKPKADYVIKAIPQFMEQSQPGGYYRSPSADGTRPGQLWINTYKPAERERFVVITTSLHEASPGHHFQSTISQEISDLPSFRRFDESTAYGEGWALYAESLGYEMGLYKDPWQNYGHLNDEAIRANRLVIDTGLHALGWTRERSITWMMEHSTMSESAATAEVERYMAIPGQALAYKIGQLEISRLRAEAQGQLGSHFDIRAFHRQILLGGSMPLPVMRAHIERWVDATRNATGPSS